MDCIKQSGASLLCFMHRMERKIPKKQTIGGRNIGNKATLLAMDKNCSPAKTPTIPKIISPQNMVIIGITRGEQYITLAELTQIGIFLVSLVSLLYAIFHNDKRK